jgi:dolichol-phosphate mannosyltransferase
MSPFGLPAAGCPASARRHVLSFSAFCFPFIPLNITFFLTNLRFFLEFNRRFEFSHARMEPTEPTVRSRPELMIVMPVYNEQASVQKVVHEWFNELENWTENFVFLAINDGSTDGTLRILEHLREQLGARFEILSRENRGHGQSCLQGYRIACEREIPWVLQIDSDGQCDPQYFFRFWRDRKKFDVIYEWH